MKCQTVFCGGKIQLNFNDLNTADLFTMANWNSFLSPLEVLPIAQENKCFAKFPSFVMKLYVVCTH